MLDAPHRRRNPLTGAHVLVSPHRGARPWLGQTEPVAAPVSPTYDPGCYLCPGNARVGGERNPSYESVFVFENDFSALYPGARDNAADRNDLFARLPAHGTSRVICFSPDHSATLPKLSLAQVRVVIDSWADQTAELGQKYAYIQVFENKGAMMGCSNPHPHGQAWATDYLPDEVAREDTHQREYFGEHERAMLMDVAAREADDGARTVALNEDWIAIVPFWAAWPFETLVLPRFAVSRMPDLQPTRRDALADLLRRLTARYDNLFATSFPYSMGWHGAPFDGRDTAAWQLHAHFYPPLLRSATVRKFMVGFEMLAEAQRDLTPEQAAERLRAVPDVLQGAV